MSSKSVYVFALEIRYSEEVAMYCLSGSKAYGLNYHSFGILLVGYIVECGVHPLGVVREVSC